MGRAIWKTESRKAKTLCVGIRPGANGSRPTRQSMTGRSMLNGHYMTENGSHQPRKQWVCRLRLQVNHPLCLWHYGLRCWAKPWLGKIPHNDPGWQTIRSNFLRLNKEIQLEFREIFSPYYHLCPNCPMNCCLSGSQSTTYDELDVLLYGIPTERILRHSKGFAGIWLKLLSSENLVNRGTKTIRNHRDTDCQANCQVAPCWDLGATGCRLPWGGRVVACTLPICGPMAAEMTWGEYGHYVRVSLRYLAFLTKTVRTVISYTINH